MLKTFIQTFKETLRKKVIGITKYLIKTAWMLAGVVWIIWQKKKNPHNNYVASEKDQTN